MKSITSKLIHGTFDNSGQNYRSLKTPVYDCASYDFESSESVTEAFKGNTDSYIYSRISNPTVKELESRLKILANSRDCLCVSSGMAAVSNTILSICDSGDNIITSNYLFGNTYSFFSKTMLSFGIEIRFVDLDNTEEIEKNIDGKTRAIFMEVQTNPQLKIYDVDAISDLAKKRNVLLIIDNSLLTPYIFSSAAHGVDIEVLSTTKFISGGATSIGGAVFTFNSDKWQYIPKLKNEFKEYGQDAFIMKLGKEIFRNIGCCMSPHNAFLKLLGLETLTIRIDKICDNALKVAEWLSKHEKVQRVEYASLKSSKNYQRSEKYFNLMSGSLIGVELITKKECYAFMDSLKMIRRGTNFCDNKSMIIHPSSTIYCDFSEEDKQEFGINDGLMRLGVGLEDVNDIITDLNHALNKI